MSGQIINSAGSGINNVVALTFRRRIRKQDLFPGVLRSRKNFCSEPRDDNAIPHYQRLTCPKIFRDRACWLASHLPDAQPRRNLKGE